MWGKELLLLKPKTRVAEEPISQMAFLSSPDDLVCFPAACYQGAHSCRPVLTCCCRRVGRNYWNIRLLSLTVCRFSLFPLIYLYPLSGCSHKQHFLGVHLDQEKRENRTRPSSLIQMPRPVSCLRMRGELCIGCGIVGLN